MKIKINKKIADGYEQSFNITKVISMTDNHFWISSTNSKWGMQGKNIKINYPESYTSKMKNDQNYLTVNKYDCIVLCLCCYEN